MAEPPISSEMSGEPDEGTIELELTLEDLSLRYATAHPASSSGKVAACGPAPTLDLRSANVTANSTAGSKVIILIGAFAIAFVSLMLESVGDRERVPGALQPYRAVNMPAQPQPLPPEQPQQRVSAVRISNPFDAAEIFEFPPGTSRAEARQWVADLLLERARGRQPLMAAVPRRRLGLSSGFRKNST